MYTSWTCVLIALLMWQPVAAEFRETNFHVLQKGTRPSNGRSISTQSGGTVISCGALCLRDSSCTSFTVRNATSCQNTCELRDQSGVTETLLEADSTASYYTKRECASSPCQHGGTCTEGMDGHTCQCAAGYTGSNCQTEVDECASNPCHNEATCTDMVNGYTCTCDVCYNRTNCEVGVILRDCSAIQAAAPCSASGVYNVTPVGGTPIEVSCDMDTDGGGWLVFQERQNGTVDFYLNWESYAAGFGELDGEFWLGNRNLHLLTQQKTYTLRVVLGDWEGNQRYAQYSSFTIDSEQDKFRLTLGTYGGDAGDGMSYISGSQFSTKDQDNDVRDNYDCAQTRTGAWWYKACSHSNLNGHYYLSGPYTYAQSETGKYNGVFWNRGYLYSRKTTRMMIRPAP